MRERHKLMKTLYRMQNIYACMFVWKVIQEYREVYMYVQSVFIFHFVSPIHKELCHCMELYQYSGTSLYIWVRILNDVQLGPDMG